MSAFQKDGSFLRKMVPSCETGKRLFSNYKDSHTFERNSEGKKEREKLFLLLSTGIMKPLLFNLYLPLHSPASVLQ